ncbi:MAG: hypothetical protein QG649_278 [Patescibacteria group bacterium]|nr:hypothetical protein [Patescibacteria group bacterium]
MKPFIIIIAVILALAAISGAGYYVYRQITDLTEQNSALQADVSQLKKSPILKSDQSNTAQPTTDPNYRSEKGIQVSVTTPRRAAVVKSPLTVAGEIPGSWSFEALFTIRLIDAQGNIVGESPASIQGDWMTDQAMPFTGKIEFTKFSSQTGTLVLLRSNPSGLAENNDTVVVPIRFN